jgi:hypothetical protein
MGGAAPFILFFSIFARADFSERCCYQLSGFALNSKLDGILLLLAIGCGTGSTHQSIAMTALDELLISVEQALRDSASKEQHASVLEILQKAEINIHSDELTRYTEENPSDDCKYTRNKLCSILGEDGNCGEVLLLIWKRRQGSLIHNHPNAECYVKVLHGELLEEVYDDDLSVTGRALLQSDDVTHINDDKGLHAMSNPSEDEVTITLHVYTSCMAMSDKARAYPVTGIDETSTRNAPGIYRDYSEYFER